MAVAVFGEALFDLIEAPAGDIVACIGGSPFNVARSFVRQGVPCTYVSPFSTDRYGQKLFDYAQAEGMQFCLLYTSPSPRDGLLSRMPSSA